MKLSKLYSYTLDIAIVISGAWIWHKLGWDVGIAIFVYVICQSYKAWDRISQRVDSLVAEIKKLIGETLDNIEKTIEKNGN